MEPQALGSESVSPNRWTAGEFLLSTLVMHHPTDGGCP